MGLKLILLTVAAALAAADSFTLKAYVPISPIIHGKAIHASGQRFIIGLDAPSSFCPRIPGITCPPGTSTTVDEDLTHLRVAVPGGQTVFIAPDGIVSYTAAHSTRIPEGSTKKGFYKKTLVSTCSAEHTQLLDFLSADNADLEGVYACPNPDLERTWLLAAAGQKSKALNGDCVRLEGLELQKSEVEIGAWQY
ncbi:IgE-binding protein [Colletotrichum truncatum]|uniref:IgE-binding protein n=1 Tax=Colletotrichum truncatum TaxID=5467 RepID=A0ACC3ZGB2_COLTU|nr:IgE-binding protein [Colletotrichum truncatum]KAF6801870.1 IgE-binding protein [Colletotrichum truncatum]